ncbi:MAG: tetratricopeptide repeat protein [Verrucomicrobiota bacterium]|jgi:tetratricopeptide (TPR) repeat protein
MSRSRWICLALLVFTVALYAPALRCQFLAIDDPAYVTENQHVRAGLTLDGLAWAFHSTTVGNWQPLAMLSHMLDCQIYGLRPWGHHLTNVLLHAANAALLFLVLTRMTGAVWRSACVAALFAMHPAHVESVAWVAERKDVLSGFFWLLAVWAWVRYAENFKFQISNFKFYYSGALLFFALALMAKPMSVTLPFVLLLLDFWPLGRARGLDWPSWRRLAVEKWPWLALSAVWCGITLWAQRVGEAVSSTAVLSVGGRVNHTMIAYWDYLRVLVFPWHLSAYYPYPHHEPVVWGVAAGAGLVVMTWLAMAEGRRRPWLPVGWLWFLGMLVPVIGLVQVGGQGWADRYTYLPSIGFFVIVVWGGAEWAARHAVVKLLIPLAGAALVAVTARELQYWKDTGTLYGRAMEVTANNYLAMTLVGTAEEGRGKLDDAIRLERQALACKPAYPEAHFFLGRALEGKGRGAEAATEYREALRLRADFDAAHVMLGLLLAGENRYDEAVAQYQAALKANPESAAAQSDWGAVLLKQGRWPESVAHYEEAVRLDPALASAHNGLGMAYLQTGRLAEGTTELCAAIKIDPGDTETRLNLGEAFNQQQQWGDAVEVLQPLALKLPAMSNAQFQYGLALEHLGRISDAINCYAAALRDNPDLPEALQHRAWIAATDARPELRDGALAVKLATRACELTGQKRPSMLLTLAAAYAESGRFEDALAAVDKAEELARAQGQKAIETEAGSLRAAFAADRPFHGQ